MMTDEDYKMKVAKKVSIRAFLPVIGLFLIVCLGVIAFILGQPLNNQFGASLNIPYTETGDLIFSAVVFGIGILLLGLVFAVFAPKPPKMINERKLDRERKALHAEAKARKQAREQAKVKMARERKASAQQNKK